MAAYVIVFRIRSTDRAAMPEYLSRARAIAEEHPYIIRALHGRHEVREGEDVESVSILEFPTFEAAQRWYDDPRYQEALAFRLQTGDFHSIIVDGA